MTSRPEIEWRPVTETEPGDETVTLYFDHLGQVTGRRFDGYGNNWQMTCCYKLVTQQPSHWAPLLPEPE